MGDTFLLTPVGHAVVKLLRDIETLNGKKSVNRTPVSYRTTNPLTKIGKVLITAAGSRKSMLTNRCEDQRWVCCAKTNCELEKLVKFIRDYLRTYKRCKQTRLSDLISIKRTVFCNIN